MTHIKELLPRLLVNIRHKMVLKGAEGSKKKKESNLPQSKNMAKEKALNERKNE